MNNKPVWRIFALFTVISSLTACSDSSISSRDTYTDTYLFYTTGSSPDVGIHAVDPANPGSPTTVETVASAPAADTPMYFLAGTMESATKTIADLHYRYLLYPLGTNFYKLSAPKSEALVKQQVSSENAADTVCSTNIIPYDDYSDPDQSVLFYTLDPADAGACNDNGNEDLYMIRLGMSSTTPPLGGFNGYTPVSPVYNSSGAITGFLLLNQTTGYIRQWSTSLTAPSAPLLTGVSEAFAIAIDSSGRVLLIINETDLHVFNPTSGTISASLHTEQSSLAGFPVPMDDTHAYFIDGNIIYRIPMDASGSSQIVVDESGGGGTLESNFSLSRGRIIYHYDDTGADYVRSVPGSGGAATTIYTLPDNPNIRSFRSAAGRIYISGSDGATRIALSVGDDGSNPQITQDAWWSGFTYHPRQSLFADFDIAGRALGGIGFTRLQARTIYQVNFTGSGNTLTSYDADTTSKLVEFGVPASDFGIYDAGMGGIYPPIVHGLANKDRTLLFYDGTNSKDVIFVHARHGGSVVRVTNDSVDDSAFGVIGGCTLGGRGSPDPLLPVLLALAVFYLWHRRKHWHGEQ